MDDGVFSASMSSLSSMGEEASETGSVASGIVSSVARRERGLVVDGSKRENERAPRSEGLSGESDRIDEPADAVCSGTGRKKSIL